MKWAIDGVVTDRAFKPCHRVSEVYNCACMTLAYVGYMLKRQLQRRGFRVVWLLSAYYRLELA